MNISFLLHRKMGIDTSSCSKVTRNPQRKIYCVNMKKMVKNRKKMPFFRHFLCQRENKKKGSHSGNNEWAKKKE